MTDAGSLPAVNPRLEALRGDGGGGGGGSASSPRSRVRSLSLNTAAVSAANDGTPNSARPQSSSSSTGMASARSQSARDSPGSGNGGFSARRLSENASQAFDTSDSSEDLFKASSRDSTLVARAKDRLEDLVDKLLHVHEIKLSSSSGASRALGTSAATSAEQQAVADARHSILIFVDDFSNDFRESISKTSSAGKKILAFREELRKQQDYGNSLRRKTVEMQEVLRKNDIQMDFLRGQLLRREKMLEEQRQAFFKELLILREQVLRKVSGEDAGEIMEFWNWQMQQSGFGGDEGGDGQEELQKRLRAIQQQNQKKLEEAEKRRIQELNQITEKKNKEVQDLRDELTNQVKSNRELEKSMREKISRLEDEHMSQVSSMKEKYEVEIQQVRDEAAEREKSIRRDSEDQLKKLRGEMQNVIDELSSENSALKEEVDKLRERLEDEIFKLRQSYERQLIEKDNEMRRVRAELEDEKERATQSLKHELAEKEYEMQKLQDTIDGFEDRLRRATEDSAGVKQQLDQANARVGDLEGQLEFQRRQIRDHESEIQVWKQKVQDATTAALASAAAAAKASASASASASAGKSSRRRPMSGNRSRLDDDDGDGDDENRGDSLGVEDVIKQDLRIKLEKDKQIKQDTAKVNWTLLGLGQKSEQLKKKFQDSNVFNRLMDRYADQKRRLEQKRQEMLLERRRNLELILDAARLLTDPQPCYRSSEFAIGMPPVTAAASLPNNMLASSSSTSGGGGGGRFSLSSHHNIPPLPMTHVHNVTFESPRPATSSTTLMKTPTSAGPRSRPVSGVRAISPSASSPLAASSSSSFASARRSETMTPGRASWQSKRGGGGNGSMTHRSGGTGNSFSSYGNSNSSPLLPYNIGSGGGGGGGGSGPLSLSNDQLLYAASSTAGQASLNPSRSVWSAGLTTTPLLRSVVDEFDYLQQRDHLGQNQNHQQQYQRRHASLSSTNQQPAEDPTTGGMRVRITGDRLETMYYRDRDNSNNNNGSGGTDYSNGGGDGPIPPEVPRPTSAGLSSSMNGVGGSSGQLDTMEGNSSGISSRVRGRLYHVPGGAASPLQQRNGSETQRSSYDGLPSFGGDTNRTGGGGGQTARSPQVNRSGEESFEWTVDFSRLNPAQRREVILDMIYRDRLRLNDRMKKREQRLLSTSMM